MFICIYVLLYEGKCKWSYGPSCPVDFPLNIFIHSFKETWTTTSPSGLILSWSRNGLPTEEISVPLLSPKPEPEATNDRQQLDVNNTIQDAILTCARKPTRVSLIYRTEPASKKCKTDMLRSNSKSAGNPCSQYWRRKRKAAVGRICRKKGFKPGMKEWVRNNNNNKNDCWQITTV